MEVLTMSNIDDLDFRTLGRTGLKNFSGYISEEFLPRLRGRRAYKQYEEMRQNNPTVGALLYLIETFVSQSDWRMEPADESEAAMLEAEFVDSCFEDMSMTWEELLSEVLTMLPFGYSWMELVYKLRMGTEQEDPELRSRYNDGRIGWRKIPIRGQDTLWEWDISDDGSILGVWQSSPPTYQRVYLPIEKSLLFRLRAHKNNPEGKSLLRNSVRSYEFIKRLEEVEAIGIERDLTGLPVMEVPPEIMSTQPGQKARQLRTELEKLIQSIRRDEREGAIVPSEQDRDGKPTGYKLKLLTSGGRRQMDIGSTVRRHQADMLMSVLCEFLLLGMQAVGARSLGDSKTSIFVKSLGAIMDAVADVFNRFAIPRLMDLNNVPQHLWPKLVHGDLEDIDLSALSTFINQLSAAGFNFTGEEVDRALRDAAGLPQKPNDIIDSEQDLVGDEQ